MPTHPVSLGSTRNRVIEPNAHPQQARRSPASLWHNQLGVEALEFALVGPVLLGLLFGLVQFGLTFSNYIALSDGVRVGARVLAISRGSTTPWTNATLAFGQATPTLPTASVTLALSVNGTACASDGACQTALTGAAGGTASITASYPCNLTIMGINYWPGCTLSAVTTEVVE
ncbi:MAG TPA: TadE/TadG family type IV pilus assembly protein [Acetobacteraceae bacterium]|nr:TadE/TadG family type IV pilus assembly protein [Acetobacteraceae bacterium]